MPKKWLAIGVHAGWNWMEDSVIGFSGANTPRMDMLCCISSDFNPVHLFNLSKVR